MKIQISYSCACDIMKNANLSSKTVKTEKLQRDIWEERKMPRLKQTLLFLKDNGQELITS